MSKLLAHLGVSESDIKMMPPDIIEAGGIVDAMYMAYAEMGKDHWLKPSLANAIAESVRILLIRVKALIRIPDEVKREIDNEMKLLPKQTMPKTDRQKSPVPNKKPEQKKKQDNEPPSPQPKTKPTPKPTPEPKPKDELPESKKKDKPDGKEHMGKLSEAQKELIKKLRNIEI